MNALTIIASATLAVVSAGLVAYAVTVHVMVPVPAQPQINQAMMTAAIIDANRQMQAEQRREQAEKQEKNDRYHCNMYPDEC